MEIEVWETAPRAGEAIAAELIRRRQKIDQEELEFSCLAAQFAGTAEYDEQGFDSPISWLKAVCHMSGGAAGDRVCVGQQMGHLGESAAALAAGEIGFAHLALIARTSAAVESASTSPNCCVRRASSTSSHSATAACTRGMRATRRVS